MSSTKPPKGQGPAPTSGPAPSEIEAQRDREIEAQRDREILGEWHKHAGLGPSQIRNQLRRRGIKISVATVRHVMEDAGYSPPNIKRDPHDQRYESLRPNHRWHRVRRARAQPKPPRYESLRPNHRWHLDFVNRHIHRASTFNLIMLDDLALRGGPWGR